MSCEQELCCLWHLSRKPLEGNMSNFGERPFRMVMRANSLMEVFCSDGE